MIFAFNQCGTPVYEFDYQPPDPFVSVSAVRRTIQVADNEQVRVVVGVRQLVDNGFEPQTTTYVLDKSGEERLSSIRATGGETGRSLLPDGSQIWGTIVPLNFGPFENFTDARQNLVIVRGDRNGQPLWRHERSSFWWAEFLGVAGPRVLFWSEGRFGALDFNTGALVWSQPTAFITSEIALSTQLNFGVARAEDQIIAVEILNGTQIFTFPEEADPEYVARTDPIISADGRVLVMMERRTFSAIDNTLVPSELSWVELDVTGQVLSETVLPYAFPGDFRETRAEDFRDDPYPTVADDGITYVGYGDHFWAIEPGGDIRWTLTSTMPDAFTATVPLLRNDGIMLISRGRRDIIGVRTNGGQMSEAGWASYRHDNDRTNFTP
ncbi:MAG: PQQ-binding-like beta-propeller repeat protein [Myxococcota bacterium]